MRYELADYEWVRDQADAAQQAAGSSSGERRQTPVSSEATPIPRGNRPSTAAVTRAGARKAIRAVSAEAAKLHIVDVRSTYQPIPFGEADSESIQEPGYTTFARLIR